MALIALFLLSAQADTSLQRRVQEAVEESAKRGLEEIRTAEEQKIVREVVSVMDGIARLINVLQYGSPDHASALLDTLIRKTDVIAKNYKADKLPISVTVFLYLGVDNPDSAEKLVREARKYLNKNDIPTAREILNLLRNEIVVHTVVVPVDVLRNSLALTKSLLEKGRTKEAIDALSLMLSSVETVESVFPKPLFDAYYLLTTVDEVQQEDTSLALEVLKVVRRKIRLAYALGYIDKKQYRELLKQVRSIEKSVKRKEKASKRITTLKEGLQKLKGEVKGKRSD